MFHGLMEDKLVYKTCSIAYGASTTCGASLTWNSTCGQQQAENVSNVVIVGLPLLEEDTVYYYVVTASNGTYRALIQGNFSKGIMITLSLIMTN